LEARFARIWRYTADGHAQTLRASVVEIRCEYSGLP
jgi:hypothetical protein